MGTKMQLEWHRDKIQEKQPCQSQKGNSKEITDRRYYQ
jgi:hypothetical protein